MRTPAIEYIMYKLVLNKHKKKVWEIVMHPSNKRIGEVASCGMPCANNLPVGCTYEQIIRLAD
jgi:hypothetical protein